MKLPRTPAELKKAFPGFAILIDALWREIHDDNVIEDIVQPEHGFSSGQVVKQAADGTWILAQADTLANAGAVGVVCRVRSADVFWVRTGGFLPGEYVPGTKYFLSAATAGGLMVEPETWETGDIKQLIGIGTGDGLLVEIGEAAEVGSVGGDGLSAYEVAVANGFVGTEAEWLASLVGPAGADGAPGSDGAPGAPGTEGRGIASLVLLSTVGKVKTYRITFTDDTTFDFQVSDGADGSGGEGGATPPVLRLDFGEAGLEYTYNVPYAMKFTSQVSENSDATLSIPLNTDMPMFTKLKITSTSPGLAMFFGEYL